MTFAELVTAIGIDTGRPDLVDDINQAIQAATISIHTTDFWKKDFTESTIAVVTDPVQFTFPIALNALARHRKLKYVRKIDPVTLLPGKYFTLVDPARLLDEYKVTKANVFYLAGQSYQCVTDTKDTSVKVGWFQHPITSPIANYASWVADEWPFAIVKLASARICTAIGKMDEAKAFMMEYNNPMDPFNPGWIQKIYAANLVEGSET